MIMQVINQFDYRMEQARSTIVKQVDEDGRGDEESFMEDEREDNEKSFASCTGSEPESLDESFKSAGDDKVITLGDSPLKDDERSEFRQRVFEDMQLCTDWMDWPVLATKLTLGDLIEFRRVVTIGSTPTRVYTHWAIYVGTMEGQPRIVHLSTENGDFDAVPTRIGDSLPTVHAKLTSGNSAEVRIDSLEDGASGDLVRINNSDDARILPLIREIAVHRATLKLGTRDYNILHNNCEHFVKWCRYGKLYSGQATLVKTLMVGSGVLVATSAVAPGMASAGLALTAMAAYSTAAVIGRQIEARKDGSRLLNEEYPAVKRKSRFGVLARSKIIEKVKGGRRMAVDLYKAMWKAMRNRKKTANRMLTAQ